MPHSVPCITQPFLPPMPRVLLNYKETLANFKGFVCWFLFVHHNRRQPLITSLSQSLRWYLTSRFSNWVRLSGSTSSSSFCCCWVVHSWGHFTGGSKYLTGFVDVLQVHYGRHRSKSRQCRTDIINLFICVREWVIRCDWFPEATRHHLKALLRANRPKRFNISTLEIGTFSKSP